MFVALYVKRDDLFIGLDGSYMRDLAARQFALRTPLFITAIDYAQGLGDTFFGVNFRLLPSFVIGSFFADPVLSKVVTYEIALIEISIAILVFGVSLGLSATVASAAAVIACVLLFPFYSPTLIYGLLPLVPQFASIMALALFATAAFLQVGRRRRRANFLFAALAVALLSWICLIGIWFMVLIGPFMFVVSVAGVIAAMTRQERRWKLLLVGATALFFLLSGPLFYFLGLILDTAAVIFPGELANNRASFFNASILFHWRVFGPSGPMLVACSVAGALLAAFDRSLPVLRAFAITQLTYLSTRLCFATLIIVFDIWRGPAAVYFEYFVIPLYAVFAAYLGARIVGHVWRAMRWSIPAAGTSLASVAVAGLAAVALTIATRPPSANYGFPFPPRPTPFTTLLDPEVGLKIGAPYRGRVVNMVGQAFDRPIDWLDLHVIDHQFSDVLGNDFRLTGLNFFGIPTFFEYTPTISPFFYAAATRLLAEPMDKQIRSVVVTRRFDPRLLAMLGVRFVIADRAIDSGATLRTTMKTKDRELFLYEIANANTGNYSPTTVTSLKSADQILGRMIQADFNPEREIIAELPESAGSLVPATNAGLVFEGASLRVVAQSSGRSTLLLPLEFSQCLALSAPGPATPRVFRANLVETGVLFEGRLDATISLRSGPFYNSACRLADFFDAREMQLGRVRTGGELLSQSAK